MLLSNWRVFWPDNRDAILKVMNVVDIKPRENTVKYFAFCCVLGDRLLK